MRGSRTTTRRRRLTIKVLQYTLLIVLAAIVLFPIYITVVNSLLTPDAVGHRPPTLFPTHPHGAGYVTAFNEGHLGLYLRNSFLMAAVITSGQVITSILAAYSFALLRFPFRNALFVVFLSTLMVPFE